MSEALTRLLHRAESYWQDALALDEMGDEGMAAAYRGHFRGAHAVRRAGCSVSARTIDSGET